MKFNKQNKILFLDPNSDHIHADEKVHIVLSPSLYWVKKISIPVKSIREVKKLLPSIFEDVLPDGKYSYSAYKSDKDSEFLIFAYEDKKILDTLVKQNISIANIVSVHFAQSELSHITEAIGVNETQSICVKDGMVILVPRYLTKNSIKLDWNSVSLSNHKIVVQQFAHIVDKKSLYGIFTVLAVLILLVFSELYITNKKSKNISELKDELFAKNSLKPTIAQNQAVLKKYKTMYSEQTKLREYISYLLDLRLKRNEQITFVSFQEAKVIVSFSGTNEKNFSHITSLLKSKKVTFTTSHTNGILNLEILL